MKRKAFLIVSLLLVLILLSGSPPVWGGGWQHTSDGPYGGVLQAIIQDGDGNYCVGVYQGWIYASDDGGGTWSLAKGSIPNTARNIRALAGVPQVGFDVFAGSYGGGVFRSSTCDGDWTAMNTSLDDLDVLSLLVVPGTPLTIYAGTDGSAVFKWEDPSGPWEDMDAGAASADALTLAIDSGGTLYMGVQATGGYEGVYQWDGAQWQPMNNGLPAETTVVSLLADGTNLWAGTEGEGVYYWNGSAWQARNSGLPAGDARTVWKVSEDANGTVYAGTQDGFYRWTGSAWQARDSGLEGNGRVVKDFMSPTGDDIYAATDGRGVCVSTDGGQNWADWQTTNEGLSGYVVRALAINPAYNPRIYAGTYKGGVFWSQSTGASWEWWSDGLGDVEVEALVASRPNGSFVYAGLAGQGVYRRDWSPPNTWTDWLPKNDGLTGNALFVNAMVVKPEDYSPIVYAGTEDGVYKSENNGDTWAQASDGLPYAVTALASDPRDGHQSTIYAGTRADGVYITANAAASWDPLGSLPGNDPNKILALVVDENGTAYAGTRDGVYQKFEGAEWEAYGLQTFPVYSMGVNPITPTLVYAGSTPPIGVVYTDTETTSWVPLNTGLQNYNVYSLSVDDYVTQTLHVGTLGSSVWDHTYGDPPPPFPELGIDLDDGNYLVKAGDNMRYTVTYYNSGLAESTNAVITLTTPYTFTEYLSSTPEFQYIDTGLYQLDVATIDPESLDDAFFYVRVLTGTPEYTLLKARAGITDDGSNGLDGFLDNNHDEDETLVAGVFYIQKNAEPESGSDVYPGEQITYTLYYSNSGEQPLTSLVMTDTLPPYVTYVPGSIWPAAQGDDSNPNQLLWTVGTLNAHLDGYAGFAVVVDDDAPEATLIENTFEANIDQSLFPLESSPVVHTVSGGVTPTPSPTPTPWATPVSAPDFIITKIETTPADPESGVPFDVHVTVKNRGTEAADQGQFWVEIYIKPYPSPIPTGPADHYLGYCADQDCNVLRADFVWPVSSLAVEQEVTVDFAGSEIFLPTADHYEVYAQVDIAFVGYYGNSDYGFYLEQSEINNVRRIIVDGSIIHLPVIVRDY